MLKRMIFIAGSITILAATGAMAQMKPQPNLADTHKEGQVSETESKAEIQKQLQGLDKNKDAQLSGEERQEMRGSMRDRVRSRTRDQ